MVMNVTKIACHDGLETIKGVTFFVNIYSWQLTTGSASVKSLRLSMTHVIAPTRTPVPPRKPFNERRFGWHGCRI
jgi:hypothetical protein